MPKGLKNKKYDNVQRQYDSIKHIDYNFHFSEAFSFIMKHNAVYHIIFHLSDY